MEGGCTKPEADRGSEEGGGSLFNIYSRSSRLAPSHLESRYMGTTAIRSMRITYMTQSPA